MKPQNYSSLSPFLRSKKNIFKIVIGVFSALIIIGFSGYKIFQLATKGEDPVSYWKFDEAQGNIAHDSTGTNDSTLGTGTSAPSWVSDDMCFNENCLQFDGSNDYISTPDNTSLDFDGNDSFTISGWFRTGPKSSGTYSLVNKKETESLATGSTAVTTIDTSTDAGTASFDASWSDRVVYDPNNNRWHVIYIDSGSDIHTKSTDATSGTSWVDGTDIKALTYDYEDFNCNGFTEGSRSYMGCTYAESSDDVLYYIRCELTNSGSYISCGSEQTVYTAADTLDDLQTPHIALDSNNCGLIVVDYEDASAVAGDTHQVWFFKEDAPCGDGTWTTKSGFPTIVQSEAGYNTDTPVGIRSFSNTLNAQLYWIDTDTFTDVDLETIIFYGATDTFGTQQVISTDVERASDNTYFDAVTFSDKNVSFARDDGTTDIDSYRIDTIDGGLSTQVDTLLNVPTASFNSLTTARVDTHSPGGDDIYTFAIDNADTSDIYYNRSTDGAVTWGGTSTLWVNSFDTKVDALSSGYSTDNCDMLVTWVGNSVSPFNINTKLINTGNCGSGVDKGYALQMESDGDVTFTVTDGNATDTVTSTAATYDDNKWHYVTAVKNAATSMKLFIDGKQVATNSSLTATGTLANSNPLYTGIGNNGSINPYNGFLDDIKIYNYARSEAQIKTDLAAKGTVNGVSAVLGNANEGENVSNGLVGYWKMDESTWVGSNAVLDSSGNMNSGTAVGNAGITAPGRFGNGGAFDGGGDRIVIGNPPQLQITEEITISAWVKTATVNRNILAKNDNTNQSYDFRIGLTGGVNLRIWVGDTQYACASSILIDDNQWHHVVGTYDSQTLYTYVDGVQSCTNTTSLGPLDNDSADFVIGSRSDTVQTFDGIIDEVRIYNRALNPSDVLQLYSFAPGPVGYWKMDDGVSGNAKTVVDLSGNSNSGTTDDGANNTGMSCMGAGKYGKSCSFDGADDIIDAGSDTSVDTISNLTVSTWIKPISVGELSSGVIVSKSDTTGDANGWVVSFDSATNQAIQFKANFSLADVSAGGTTDEINLNQWNYITVTWDGTIDSTGIHIYINGIETPTYEITSEGDGTYQSDASQNIRIGNIGNSTRTWNGQIDDLKIYNYIRTSQQIIADMNAGHPAPGSPIGSALGHWKLDEGYGTITNNSGNAGIGLTGILGTGTSSPTWTNDGKFSKALSFDGTSDYFVVTDNNALDAPDEFTISLWANPTKYTGNTQNQGFMVSKGIYPNYNYRLLTEGTSGNRFEVGVNVGSTGFLSLSTNNTFSTGTWYNVIGSYDGNNLKIYVNGKLDNNVAVGGTLNTNTTDLYVGKYANGVGYEYKGLLDEIKMYTYALSDDQVKVEYNQGKAQVMGAKSTGVGGTSPSNSASRAYCVPGDSSTCNEPIGEWLFNEGVGTTANDTSGSTNPGNFGPGTSAPTWTKGKFGNALDFDGSSDYVETTSSTSIVTGAFTMSGWVYFDQEKNYQGVFGKFTDCAGSAATAYDFCIGAGAGGGMWAQVTNSSGATVVSSSITESYAGQWMHLAMVWNGVSNLKFYKNGILRDSDTTALTLSTDHPVRMGAKTNNGRDIDGKIDEVRLYNYARTPAQIAWEYNQGKPIVHYQLNECTGSTVNNNTRDGNNIAIGSHGTITIGASGSQTSAGTCSSGISTEAWNNGTAGKIESSLSFDGVDDYITIADTGLLDFTEGNDFSYSMWVKPATITDNGTILAKKTGTGSGAAGYLTYISNQGKIATYISDGTDQISKFTDKTISAGAWSYITVVYVDDTSLTMYINGVNGGGTLSGTIANVDDAANASPMVIGAESDFQVLRDGQIDEVKIFNYALTPTQIKLEMANGAVRFQ